MSKTVNGCLVAVLLLIAGCSKAPPPETNQPAPLQPLTAKEDAPPPPPDPTAPAPAQPVEAAPAMDVETTLVTLNSMVSDFNMSRSRLPNGIEELVALKLLPAVPQAPPGKKFVIDPKLRQVVLANK